LRKLYTLILLLLLTAVAYGQSRATPSCDNPTDPINGVTNRAPVPPSSWRAPHSAVVGADLTIDKQGKVKDAVIVNSGGKDADNAVLIAVRNWTYTPAMCGLTPTETTIHVRISLQVDKHNQ